MQFFHDFCCQLVIICKVFILKISLTILWLASIVEHRIHDGYLWNLQGDHDKFQHLPVACNHWDSFENGHLLVEANYTFNPLCMAPVVDYILEAICCIKYKLLDWTMLEVIGNTSRYASMCATHSSVTVWVKTHLVCTCQYFKKYHFKNSMKKTSLALVPSGVIHWA